MIEDIVRSPITIACLSVASLIAALTTFLMLGRITTSLTAQTVDDNVVRRILRNSAIPIGSQLFIRVLDLGVALFLLRMLGPEGNGRYALAIVIWLYVKTVSDFGLSLLATRDIARDRTLTGSLVGATTLLRLGILVLAVLPIGLYVAIGFERGNLASESALAIALLFLSIIPSSFSEAANSALNGHERMEVAAWINIGVSMVRAPLVIVLASTELGVVGVAVAALVTAALSAELFRRALSTVTRQRTIWRLRRERAVQLMRASWPLLVNALLVNLFFRVDVFLVQAFDGDGALGVYDASYKLINLVTIVPAYITLAIFPAMAIRAHDPEALERAQGMATYLLVWIAWGIVTIVSASAGIAIHILAGAAYIPEAATLLRILIWFAPLSFLNGVIQYVLVAAGMQHRIVPAFVAAVAFNLGANLLLVPMYGARAAAVVTVLTEIVILAAFITVTRRSAVRAVSRSGTGRLWRPTVTGLVSVAVVLPLAIHVSEWLAVATGACLFAGCSVLLGVLGPTERELLRRALSRGEPVASA